MNKLILSSVAFSFFCVSAMANDAVQQQQQQQNFEQQAQQQEEVIQQEQMQAEEEAALIAEQQEVSDADALRPHPRPYPGVNPWRPRPRPYPIHAYYRCTARDRGWEEHGNSHTAEGYTYNNVYYRALSECQRYHGACSISCYRIN